MAASASTGGRYYCHQSMLTAAMMAVLGVDTASWMAVTFAA